MTARQRVASLDIIRGAVMVLMAIDHVRVYSGVPAGGPTLGIFFTRWITHFCAPAFVFFAGTAAFLRGRQGGSPTATAGDNVSLARYLVTRGLMLVLLELTVFARHGRLTSITRNSFWRASSGCSAGAWSCSQD